MNYVLRDAEEKDVDKLKTLYKEFIYNMSQYDQTDCNMDEEVDQWIVKAVNKKKSVIVVAVYENQIIGFARVQEKERTENGAVPIRYIKLSDLYVVPTFRKMGVGISLVERAKLWGKENKVSEIVLNVYESNTSAMNFYLNLGFAFRATLSLNRIRMTAKLL